MRVMPIGLAIALALAGCARQPDLPVEVIFPDFPENTATIDLGQSVTIDVETKNDGGAGVTWSCKGEGCGVLKPTSQSLTFKAIGITGKAVVTATSKKQPGVRKDFTVKVGLNESPDQLCK